MPEGDLEDRDSDIIVVSGLPRSGTSLMMQILHAWGIPLLVDDQRPPDESNPNGYFEYQPVKNLDRDASWLFKAKGKAIKIISHFLFYLPDTFHYKIIFMNRELEEIIRSQNKMLQRLNKPMGRLSIERLKIRFERHLQEIHQWMTDRPNIDFIDLWFQAIIQQPEKELPKIRNFLKLAPPPTKVLSRIDPKLYRSKINSPQK